MMEAAIHIKPFGFDRVFRLATADPAALGGEAEGHAQAQIDVLKAKIDHLVEAHDQELARARADGFEAGLALARGERDAALLAAVDAVHAALDDMDVRFREATEVLNREAADVALVAAELLAGHAVALAPAKAIDEALGRVLRQVARGTQLGVRVHPSLVADMERRIADRQAQDRRRLLVTVIADEAITAGDAHIFWEEGGLAVDAGARRAAVMAELIPLLAKPGDVQQKDSNPARIA